MCLLYKVTNGVLGINCCCKRGGGGNYVNRSELLSRGCGLFSLSVDVTVFAMWYLETCTKGSVTFGVSDPSVKSTNIMLVI